jgi:cullin-4
MIDSTLKLKRFADRAVASLFDAPVRTIHSDAAADAAAQADDGMDVDDAQAAKVSPQGRIRQLELEEAVRTGFKSGLANRQNAPAEWIGA